MTFEEWYEAEAVKSINNRTFKEFARVAWEAALREQALDELAKQDQESWE